MDHDHGGLPVGEGAPPPLPANRKDGYSPYPVHYYTHYHHAAHHQGGLPTQQQNWNYHQPQPHYMYHIPPHPPQQDTQQMNCHQHIPTPQENNEAALNEQFPSTTQNQHEQQQQQQQQQQQHEIEIDKIDPVPVNVQHHHHDYRQSDTHQQQNILEPRKVPLNATTATHENDACIGKNENNDVFQSSEIGIDIPITQQVAAATAAVAVEATNDGSQQLQQTSDSLEEKEMASAKNENSSIPNNSDDDGQHKSSFPFNDILTQLQTYKERNNHVNIPTSDPTYTQILDSLIKHGIEHDTNKKWVEKYNLLKGYKDKHGDSDMPEADLEMGDWIKDHRKLQAKADLGSDYLFQHRFQLLDQLGFDWNTPPWDVRYQELTTFNEVHNHCDVKANHPGGLGIWVVNQRFNVRDMPQERITVLDALGFIWNHNRKDRKDDAWNLQFEALMEYKRENGHCNVPTTRASATKLGKWVGKQREEYKKWDKKKKQSQLSQYRFDKLNEAGFQWSLMSKKTLSWEERFEALKRFKEKNGHCAIPRGHVDFGSWPNYQRNQYTNWKEGKPSKLTKEKVDKLIEIGFLS